MCFGMEVVEDRSSSYNVQSLIVDALKKNIKDNSPKKNIVDTATKDISNAFSKKKENMNSINTENILSQIEEFEEKKEFYAEWFASKIFLVEASVWWQQKKLLVIKNLLKQSWESRDDVNKRILNEYQLYLQSYHVLSKTENSIVQVPKTYWVLNDHEWYMMLMLDYVSWMTLFAFKVSLILPVLYRQLQKDIWIERTMELLWPDKKYTNLTIDKEIKTALLEVLHVFRHHNSWDFYNEHLYFFEKYFKWQAYSWTYAEAKMANIYDSLSSDIDLWVFSQNDLLHVQDALLNGIQNLHDNDIYHNDMNQRNIILWTDGKIYIIDFDKSSTIPPNTNFVSNLSGLMWDPKYLPKYKWKYLDGDFKIIRSFEHLIKK